MKRKKRRAARGLETRKVSTFAFFFFFPHYRKRAGRCGWKRLTSSAESRFKQLSSSRWWARGVCVTQPICGEAAAQYGQPALCVALSPKLDAAAGVWLHCKWCNVLTTSLHSCASRHARAPLGSCSLRGEQQSLQKLIKTHEKEFDSCR